MKPWPTSPEAQKLHNSFISGYRLAAEDILKDLTETEDVNELRERWFETLTNIERSFINDDL